MLDSKNRTIKISWIIIFFIRNSFWVSIKAQARVGDNCTDANVPYYSPEIIKYNFKGQLGDMMELMGNHWFQDFVNANPYASEMFHIKGRSPEHSEREMWWQGEYLGKHLLGGISLYKMSGNPQLKKQIEVVIRRLMAAQEQDGYWGSFPEEERLYANNWDVWGQYHLELAFLEWYDFIKDKEIRWYMNEKFHLAMLIDTMSDTNIEVIDFTSCEKIYEEPESGSTRNWSLLGEINQKQTRPKDVPVDILKLPEYIKQSIRGKYPDLLNTI